MLWFFLALLTAVASASEAAVVKRGLGHLSSEEMLLCFQAWGIPFFFAFWLWLGMQPLAEGFWGDLLIMLPLNILGIILQFTALRLSPLSLVFPFLAFTPAFMVLTGYVFLGEMPSVWGGVGIALIVAGSWVLNLDSGGGSGFFDPFKAIIKERGTRLALLAAFIWSLAAVFSKRLALRGDPVYVATVFFLIHNIVLVAGLLAVRRARLRVVWEHRRAGIAAAGLLAVHVIAHFSAISLVNAAYMISIKRLNGLISVIYGALLLKETQIRSRLAGAGVMAVGAAVIALMG